MTESTSPVCHVYMLDLWCQIPFYNAYLCQALTTSGVECTLGATSFHLEENYFRERGVKTDRGLLNLVSRIRVRHSPFRRMLRFVEFCINLLVIAWRFLNKRPDILHVQWIPLIAEGVPFEFWFLRFAKWRRIKLVYTVHNLLPHDSHPRVKKIFLKVYR